MGKPDPDILAAFLEFEIFLTILESFDPAEHVTDMLRLAAFSVADEKVGRLIISLSSQRLTQRQQAAFRARVARYEALGTPDLRALLYPGGCAPARKSIVNAN